MKQTNDPTLPQRNPAEADKQVIKNPSVGGMNIRQLTANDARAYRDLRLEALIQNPDAYLATFESESQKNISDFAWELRACLKAPIEGYYGVFDNDHLIAYLQISKTGLAKQNHIIFLYNLYVDHHYRRQKIGSSLVSYIIEQIREKDAQIEQIFLAHNGKNIGARNLYQSLGFKQFAIQKNTIKYKNEYDDTIEMVYKIKQNA